MSRDRELAQRRRTDDASARPERHADNPVLALQQAAGNRAVGGLLARKAAGGSKGPTVTLGKLSIEVSGGNIDAWAGGDVPESLQVASQHGHHSAELDRMFKEHTRIASLTLTVAAESKAGSDLDMGSLAIEITNGRIKHYDTDGTAESWSVADFDGVHRTKISHRVGQ